MRAVLPSKSLAQPVRDAAAAERESLARRLADFAALPLALIGVAAFITAFDNVTL